MKWYERKVHVDCKRFEVGPRETLFHMIWLCFFSNRSIGRHMSKTVAIFLWCIALPIILNWICLAGNVQSFFWWIWSRWKLRRWKVPSYIRIIANPLFQHEATRNSNVTDPFARYKSSYALNGASPKVGCVKHRIFTCAEWDWEYLPIIHLP